MEAPIIDDELWILIEPLLPPAKLRAKSDPGRPRVSDRAALNGILFVFKTGIRWNHLPTRLGFGSGATCWRRLSDWQKAGVWDQLHELLLDKLRAAALRERGIKPVIAKRRTEHGSGLGKYRWVVERTHSWLHNFRRLRTRFERSAYIHEAFLKLGCSIICWNIFRRAVQGF
ncbi:transposase [Burkholderia glumae]|uniref:transposase n=1 Tax=Burkholderia glumae TaxID=337 RepID=UPI00265E622E|nr:transposase [Burkholderia glumae]